MLPTELINIAYQENIEIEPKCQIPILHLMQADFGPFSPLEIPKIPIYIALLLKKANQCRIRLPTFFDPNILREILQNEKDNDEYTQIHPFTFELIGLLEHCYNVGNVDEIKILINEIKTIRHQKTHNGLKRIDSRALNLNNLTSWEFNEFKEFLLNVMGSAKKLEE
ncbi:hypothetical protein EDEG_02380 [Edhazardia aedis USNM 41457]|uniref:Uncharacterized protein n=1 Tax=Edhazardia aedis (strain USNM 41457) TaxID=1003232 RepID=J9DKZ5_EDHAE|nr:hypothetical protein EDEG_02380 [Edhazardia aedis USNM 41457]|eukprot:EJW03265.1 hypothetical protein EDEG_02380 [Edhazardia aedis USNM 41457]